MRGGFLKIMLLFIFFMSWLFAATNLSTSFVYDSNLTVSWTPSTSMEILIYETHDTLFEYIDENNETQYDINTTTSFITTLPSGSVGYTLTGLTPHTSYRVVVSEDDSNATIDVNTTHVWNAILSECATKKQTPPTKAVLESISSFTCSYNGGISIDPICDLKNVTKIVMRGNILRSSLPACVGNLSELKYFNISGNRMTGQIPPEIGQLENLEVLDISSNDFSKLPAEIGDLDNLKELHAASCRLVQKIPPELGNLWNLEKLYLQDNRLFGEIPEEIGNLLSLKKLRLNQNNLRGVIPVSFVDLNLSQPNGLGLHENCRIELPIDDNETNETNETAVVLDWLDSKASLYRGYSGMQQTGGHCWTPAMVPILMMYLLDSNTSDENTSSSASSSEGG
jgi:Leucine-rich repeat (LRR) protein